MPFTCCVPGCSGKTEKGRKVHIFAFPKEEDRIQVWLDAIQRDKFVPSKYSKVCEVHFKKEDIKYTSDYYDADTGRHYSTPLKIPRLWSTAIPVYFPNRQDNPATVKSTKKPLTPRGNAPPPTTRQRTSRQNATETESPTTPEKSSHPTKRIGGQNLQPPPTKKSKMSNSQDPSSHQADCPLYKFKYTFANLRGLVACNTKTPPPEPWHVVAKPDSVSYIVLEIGDAVPRMARIATVDKNLQLSMWMDDVGVLELGERKFPYAVHDITEVHAILEDFTILGEMSQEAVEEDEVGDEVGDV